MRRSCHFGGVSAGARFRAGPSDPEKARIVPHMTRQRQNRRHVAEKKCFFPFLSVPLHSPLCQTQSTTWTLTRTQPYNVEPRGMLKPHELATSDPETTTFSLTLIRRLMSHSIDRFTSSPRRYNCLSMSIYYPLRILSTIRVRYEKVSREGCLSVIPVP